MAAPVRHDSSPDPGAPPPQMAGRDAPRPRWRRRLAVLGAVLGLAAAGAAAAWQEPAAAPSLTSEGPAPSFDLPRLRDPSERVTLDDVRGTPAVINFWASWCVPCRRETPVLNAVARELSGRVAFVGINDQDDESPAETFDAITGGGYPSGFDADGEVGKQYALYGLPTTIFVAADGTIVGRRLGEMSDAELRDLIMSAFDIDVGEAAT